MKREYTKPFVVFENFSMSTNIAAGCEVKTNLPAPGILCGYKPDRWVGDPVFTEANNGCISKPPTGMDAICYHVPSESYNLFAS